MFHKTDPVIDTLIKPPVVKFTGWDESKDLRPTGDAGRDRVLAEVLRPRE